MILYTLLIVVTLLAIGQWCRVRARQIEAGDTARDEFFKAASVLVEDRDTPDEVVEAVMDMSSCLTSARISRNLLRALILPGRRHVSKEDEAEINQLFETAMAMRDPLDKQFVKAMAMGLMAITFNSPIAGTLIRRVALLGARTAKNADAEVTGTVTKAYVERIRCARFHGRNHDDHRHPDPDGPGAAAGMAA